MIRSVILLPSRSAILALAVALFPVWSQQADISIDVDRVTLACAVETAEGVPAGGLKADDFRILDDGVPREIRGFWRESALPLTVALLADVSGSQAGYVKSHRDAILQFLNQVMGASDRAMLVEVAEKAWLLAGLTGSGSDLRNAVAKIGEREGRASPLLGPACRNTTLPHSCGGTALWHALYYTVREMKPAMGRKAIVVLSDGLDTGSDVKLSAVIEAAQAEGIVVYTIRYASPMRFLSIGGAIATSLSHGLERASVETGGISFPNPGSRLNMVFERIETDLRNLYLLSFALPAEADDGRFHKLQVIASGQGLSVRTRTGYRAPDRPPQSQ